MDSMASSVDNSLIHAESAWNNLLSLHAEELARRHGSKLVSYDELYETWESVNKLQFISAWQLIASLGSCDSIFLEFSLYLTRSSAKSIHRTLDNLTMLVSGLLVVLRSEDAKREFKEQIRGIESVLIACMGHNSARARSLAIKLLNSLYDRIEWQFQFPYEPEIRFIGDQFDLDLYVPLELLEQEAGSNPSRVASEIRVLVSAPSFSLTSIDHGNDSIRSGDADTVLTFHTPKVTLANVWIRATVDKTESFLRGNKFAEECGNSTGSCLISSHVDDDKSRLAFLSLDNPSDSSSVDEVYRLIQVAHVQLQLSNFPRCGFYDYRVVHVLSNGTMESPVGHVTPLTPSELAVLVSEGKLAPSALLEDSLSLSPEANFSEPITPLMLSPTLVAQSMTNNVEDLNLQETVPSSYTSCPAQGRFIVHKRSLDKESWHQIQIDLENLTFLGDSSSKDSDDTAEMNLENSLSKIGNKGDLIKHGTFQDVADSLPQLRERGIDNLILSGALERDNRWTDIDDILEDVQLDHVDSRFLNEGSAPLGGNPYRLMRSDDVSESRSVDQSYSLQFPVFSESAISPGFLRNSLDQSGVSKAPPSALMDKGVHTSHSPSASVSHPQSSSCPQSSYAGHRALAVRPSANPHAVIDRTAPIRMLGGPLGLRRLINRVKTSNPEGLNAKEMGVFVTLEPFISASRPDRKYSSLVVHSLDERGVPVPHPAPDSRENCFDDQVLLNFRLLRTWELLCSEAKHLMLTYGLQGLYLPEAQSYPFQMSIDSAELHRLDSDGEPHHAAEAVFAGQIVQLNEEIGFWGSRLAATYPQPLFVKLMKDLWRTFPEAVIIGESHFARDAVLLRSGIVPHSPSNLLSAVGHSLNFQVTKMGHVEASSFAKEDSAATGGMGANGNNNRACPVGRLRALIADEITLTSRSTTTVASADALKFGPLPNNGSSIVLRSLGGPRSPYPALLLGRSAWTAVDIACGLPGALMTFQAELEGGSYRVSIGSTHERVSTPVVSRVNHSAAPILTGSHIGSVVSQGLSRWRERSLRRPHASKLHGGAAYFSANPSSSFAMTRDSISVSRGASRTASTSPPAEIEIASQSGLSQAGLSQSVSVAASEGSSPAPSGRASSAGTAPESASVNASGEESLPLSESSSSNLTMEAHIGAGGVVPVPIAGAQHPLHAAKLRSGFSHMNLQEINFSVVDIATGFNTSVNPGAAGASGVVDNHNHTHNHGHTHSHSQGLTHNSTSNIHGTNTNLIHSNTNSRSDMSTGSRRSSVTTDFQSLSLTPLPLSGAAAQANVALLPGQSYFPHSGFQDGSARMLSDFDVGLGDVGFPTVEHESDVPEDTYDEEVESDLNGPGHHGFEQGERVRRGSVRSSRSRDDLLADIQAISVDFSKLSWPGHQLSESSFHLPYVPAMNMNAFVPNAMPGMPPAPPSSAQKQPSPGSPSPHADMTDLELEYRSRMYPLRSRPSRLSFTSYGKKAERMPEPPGLGEGAAAVPAIRPANSNYSTPNSLGQFARDARTTHSANGGEHKGSSAGASASHRSPEVARWRASEDVRIVGDPLNRVFANISAASLQDCSLLSSSQNQNQNQNQKEQSILSVLQSLEQKHRREVGPEFGFDLQKIAPHYRHRQYLHRSMESLRRGTMVLLDAKHRYGMHGHVLALGRYVDSEVCVVAANLNGHPSTFSVDCSSLARAFGATNTSDASLSVSQLIFASAKFGQQIRQILKRYNMSDSLGTTSSVNSDNKSEVSAEKVEPAIFLPSLNLRGGVWEVRDAFSSDMPDLSASDQLTNSVNLPRTTSRNGPLVGIFTSDEAAFAPTMVTLAAHRSYCWVYSPPLSFTTTSTALVSPSGSANKGAAASSSGPFNTNSLSKNVEINSVAMHWLMCSSLLRLQAIIKLKECGVNSAVLLRSEVEALGGFEAVKRSDAGARIAVAKNAENKWISPGEMIKDNEVHGAVRHNLIYSVLRSIVKRIFRIMLQDIALLVVKKEVESGSDLNNNLFSSQVPLSLPGSGKGSEKSISESLLEIAMLSDYRPGRPVLRECALLMEAALRVLTTHLRIRVHEETQTLYGEPLESLSSESSQLPSGSAFVSGTPENDPSLWFSVNPDVAAVVVRAALFLAAKDVSTNTSIESVVQQMPIFQPTKSHSLSSGANSVNLAINTPGSANNETPQTNSGVFNVNSGGVSFVTAKNRDFLISKATKFLTAMQSSTGSSSPPPSTNSDSQGSTADVTSLDAALSSLLLRSLHKITFLSPFSDRYNGSDERDKVPSKKSTEDLGPSARDSVVSASEAGEPGTTEAETTKTAVTQRSVERSGIPVSTSSQLPMVQVTDATRASLYCFERSLVKFSELISLKNELGPIVFFTPELGKWSTVGGLGVMVDELSVGLAELGADVVCVSPCYHQNRRGKTDYLAADGITYSGRNVNVWVGGECIELGVHTGSVNSVRLLFLHNHRLFPYPYSSSDARGQLRILAAFARASLEALCQWRIIPSVAVTNDWFTGLVPAYARNRHFFGSTFRATDFLHIAHNLDPDYEGRLWPNREDGVLQDLHGLDPYLLVDPFWSDVVINPTRCALLCSDSWATVSRSYRHDLLHSSPLRALLRLSPHPFAHPNGIPVKTRSNRLKKLKHNTHNLSKRFLLQRYFGVNFQGMNDTAEGWEARLSPEEARQLSIPLFAFIGRITQQKGVHLISQVIDSLMYHHGGNLRFLVGGMANLDDPYGKYCASQLNELKARFAGRVWADPLSFFGDGDAVNLGADFCLMPSAFEPGGIVQQEFFVAGTPVIAFKTGGLKDTIEEYDRERMRGSGFLFEDHQANDLEMAINRAISVYYDTNIPQSNALKAANESDSSTTSGNISVILKGLRTYSNAFFPGGFHYHCLRSNAANSVVDLSVVSRAWFREFHRLRRCLPPPVNISKSHTVQLVFFEKAISAGTLPSLSVVDNIEKVAIAGEFNKWKPEVYLQKRDNNTSSNNYNYGGSGKVWSVELVLQSGSQPFKFVINGEHWVTVDTYPVVTDSNGLSNNLINISYRNDLFVEDE